MNLTFPSKIDWWLALILIWGALMPIFIIGFAVQSSHQYWLLPLALLPCAIYGLVVFPCRYVFEQSQLLIRVGLVRIRLPYSEIDNWRKTHNPLSSPALSLDRVRIESRRRTVMISPARQEEFISELERRVAASHLKRN